MNHSASVQKIDLDVQKVDSGVQKIDLDASFDRIPIAKGAGFDSHADEHNARCLKDTRVDVLRSIYDWIENPKSKTVYWLNGMAGTGKSTISRTVAMAQHKKGDLGASFFFKRGETDRGNAAKFVTTLARQLALSVPAVASFIKKALDADAAIVDKSMREQFKQLIQEPLLQASAEPSCAPSAVIVVVDALDECDRDRDIWMLIDLFSKAILPHSRLRVFLTSRPDLPIRLGFSRIQGSYETLILHEMAVQIVAGDIHLFLINEFAQIRTDFNRTVGELQKLSLNWPGEDVIQTLTQMAVPLFIFAATVCRFVNDRKESPRSRLKSILESRNKKYGSQLDQTYGPILKSLVTGVSKHDAEEIIDKFKTIIGAIATLASPLSVEAISQILECPSDDVWARLDGLHSVLSVPSTPKAPVRLLHLSFRDYLVTEESDFSVDEAVTHLKIANGCLRVMSKFLKENICGLPFPGTHRSEVSDKRIDEKIPAQLQYACMRWIYHITNSSFDKTNAQAIHHFLKKHFLHWLEALSLLHRIRSMALDSIISLANWSQVSPTRMPNLDQNRHSNLLRRIGEVRICSISLTMERGSFKRICPSSTKHRYSFTLPV